MELTSNALRILLHHASTVALEDPPMPIVRNPGRVAGVWYLLLVLCGPPRLIIIPNKLFVLSDPALTVAHIAAHQDLFRFGILTDIACGVVLIYLVLAFYRLFQSDDIHLAMQVIVFGGVMPAVLCFVNVVNDLAALYIVRGAEFLSVFTQPQQDALVVLFLRLHGFQSTAAEMLWGVWLFPLGLLVCRSRFLPRFIGVWLLINGVAYVVLSLTGIFDPHLQQILFTWFQPALLGEMVLMLWLVIKGAKPVSVAMTASV